MRSVGPSTPTPDFLIVGGGVVGLTAALEARRRHPTAKVMVLEKEPRCGQHASGRNSGVVHAGFYYASDSLKARLTRQGNLRLQAYCEDRGLPLYRCGKLVVARDLSELNGLEELRARGEANGVPVELVSAREAREIEPRARTAGRALFSPSTATVDPASVVDSLTEDAERAGVEVRTGCEYLGRAGKEVRTSDGRISPGYLINAAGLHADRVARDFGFADRYRILPFKGLYLEAPWERLPLRVHVYPVPELDYPFLGVHFTVSVRNRVKIGPTATPAFWREQYRGLENFRPWEAIRILGLEARLFFLNAFHFRKLAGRELLKHSRAGLVRRASELITDDPSYREWKWGSPGIRAQLLDVKENRLEMDFRVEGDDQSLHVLNAVSPAFTCAFPFAEFLFDRIERLVAGERERAVAVD